MSNKEREEWINWVKESVTFYTNKINELDKLLEDKNLSHEERQILEAERTSTVEDRKKWEQAQNKLNKNDGF